MKLSDLKNMVGSRKNNRSSRRLVQNRVFKSLNRRSFNKINKHIKKNNYKGGGRNVRRGRRRERRSSRRTSNRTLSRRRRSARRSARRGTSKRTVRSRSTDRRRSTRSSGRRTNRRVIRGGNLSFSPFSNIEGFNIGPISMGYSPLPCNDDGTTNWNSEKQVGHETCVEYGTEGAESDSRASGLGVGKLADIGIQDTISGSKLSAEQASLLAENRASANSGFQDTDAKKQAAAAVVEGRANTDP